MSSLVALSVSIGILGGVATALFLSRGLLIWAGFLAWGCFFQAGGNTTALKNTIVCSVFGAVMAWIAAYILLSFPIAAALGLPLGAGVVVGVTVLILVLAANLPALSTIPASVYGYAATFAYLLQTPDALQVVKVTSFNMANGPVLVIISMVVGSLFGFASGKMAGALTKA